MADTVYTNGDDYVANATLSNNVFLLSGNDVFVAISAVPGAAVAGGAGDDYISAPDGADAVLYGESGNDTLIGGKTQVGGAGADIGYNVGAGGFFGEAGGDVYVGTGNADGGAGTDIVRVSATLASIRNGSTELTHWRDATETIRVTTAGGTTIARNFEIVEGDDFVYIRAGLLENGGGADAASVFGLYQGAFGRLPDAKGLAHWLIESFEGMTLEGMAGNFLASQEAQNLYGGGTDEQFVTKLYGNVLGRAPDQMGLEGWINHLESGASRAQVLVGFSESAENKANVADQLSHPDGLILDVVGKGHNLSGHVFDMV